MALGIVDQPGDLRRPAPPAAVLGLGMRKAVLPQRFVDAAARALSPLFPARAVVAVVLGLGAVDTWFFAFHGAGASLAGTLTNPGAMVLTYAVLVLSALFYELGHAAGGRYAGARPGRIGFGLYLMWPAFFNDMTDSYRLSRAGRLRTDLGGVYFNAVFVLACAATYWVTGFEPILATVVLQHLLVACQFVPFLRLDGYYIVSDLIGVPDLFSRIRPVLKSLVPGRRPDPAVGDLRPGAQALVTIWGVVTVALLAAATGLLVAHLPTLAGDASKALASGAGTLRLALEQGSLAAGAIAGLNLAVLSIMPVGLALTALVLLRRAVGR